MHQPKRIAKEAVPAALEKALRYRLLNEPHEAESICLDILEVDPQNQQALINLLLAVTDQFVGDFTMALERAKETMGRLEGEYEQAYYEGIIHERWAKAQHARGTPGEFAFRWLRDAMRCYERAEQLAEPGDPEATLRYNTCVRMLSREAKREPSAETVHRDVEAEFGEDAPAR